VNISFKTCDLAFEIACADSLSPPVLEIVEPFLYRFGPKYTLQLRHQPDKSNLLGSLCQDSLEDLQQLIEVRLPGRRKIEMDLLAYDSEVVSAAIGCLLSVVLAKEGGLLLHAAFLHRADKAYLILGASGAGKSTLARNVSSMECIHDDKVAVRKVDGQWRAYGVPMLDNHKHTGRNVSARLAGLYFIEQAHQLELLPLKKRRVFEKLPPQVIVPENTMQPEVFEVMMRLATEVPGFGLRFRKDSNADQVI
jgi:hypothetical protein